MADSAVRLAGIPGVILGIGQGGRMTAEALEDVRRWDALPVGLRHVRNFPMVAVEHLALPGDQVDGRLAT